MPSETVLGKGRLERVADYRDAIRTIGTGDTAIDAVALKAVHAGPNYRGTFLVDDDVVAALRQFLPAAPAHNAIYLTAIEAFREAMPGTPIVAAFEPEFHATMPEHARLYGVPGQWLADGVAKYGFHGASHQYVSERVAEMLGPQRQAGELSPGRQLVDVRGGRRPVGGYDDGFLAAVRPGECDPARRSGRVRGPVHDGAARVDGRGSAGATGEGRGTGGPIGCRGGDLRDIEAAGDAPGGIGARGLRLPGEEDDRGVRGGDGRLGRGGVYRWNRREFGAIAGSVLRGAGIPRDRPGSCANERGSGDRLVSAADRGLR